MTTSLAGVAEALPPAHDVFPAPFPVNSRTATSNISGIATTATSFYFADKILFTITQAGRLSQWIQVPLTPANPLTDLTSTLQSSSDEMNLLPHLHLTPQTLLGAGTPERETLGQLLASQIASQILAKDPEEKRMVVVGTGLLKVPDQEGREGWFDLVDLVREVI